MPDDDVFVQVREIAGPKVAAYLSGAPNGEERAREIIARRQAENAKRESQGHPAASQS